MASSLDTEGYSRSLESTRSDWRRRLRMLGRARTALFGATFLFILVLVAVTAHWIAPYDPNEQVLQDRLLPPAWSKGGVPEHILGTDHLGRDILSRMLHGSRVSLTVGILAVAISGVLGIGLGLIAGYYGGLADTIIMRVLDVQLAFPFVLLALAIVAVLGPNLRNVIIVLGVAGWMVYARVVRGQVLSIKEKDFVEAARCLGVKDTRIILRHILPNTLASVIVVATFAVATNILLEASLTFLGVGVQARIPTWGSMLSDGRAYVATAWWLTTFPGLAMMLTLLSINMIGDWMRDAFDPHLRNL
jgi:peptide/nickel transport system permease protein